MRFGIIGTNFIVDRFIEAGKLIEDFQVKAIYSRKYETGKAFGGKYGVENIFTDIDAMIESNLIDAVYIASPNSLHCEQSIKFLKSGIPVLCEKPLASNEREVKILMDSARENETFIMEAMRIGYNPKYQKLREQLEKIGPIRGVYANFCQYSSRYDKYKEGIILNTFKRELSNGSVMDIGVYGIHFIYGLFGRPELIQAQGVLLETGVDGSGDIMLKYPGFTAIVNHSKIADSNMPSEIIGEKGSIIIEKLSTLGKVTVKYRDGSIIEFEENEMELDMYYEIKYFMENCRNRSFDIQNRIAESSLGVAKILDEARKQIGVKFPADL